MNWYKLDSIDIWVNLDQCISLEVYQDGHANLIATNRDTFYVTTEDLPGLLERLQPATQEKE